MKIIWSNPPPDRRGGAPARHTEFFNGLRKHPGRWAIFHEDIASSVSTRIKDGRYSGTRPGEFDAVFRARDGMRRGTVYVRYVGAPKAQSNP